MRKRQGRVAKSLTASPLDREREKERQGWDHGEESTRERTRQRETVVIAAKGSMNRESGKQFLSSNCPT